MGMKMKTTGGSKTKAEVVAEVAEVVVVPKVQKVEVVARVAKVKKRITDGVKMPNGIMVKIGIKVARAKMAKMPEIGVKMAKVERMPKIVKMMAKVGKNPRMEKTAKMQRMPRTVARPKIKEKVK